MSNRRSFLKNLSALGAGLWAWPLVDTGFASQAQEIITNAAPPSPAALAENEDFWNWVRQNFSASSSLVNLNNGGVSPHPKVVQEAVVRLTEMSNEAPSYYMWRILEKGRETIRTKLAEIAGCGPEEIAINRNTTESLDTIIFGLDLKKGDEVVHCNFIYPNMEQAWKQREMRDGIVRKVARLPMPSVDKEAMVKAFTDQFTDKTKLVHITHLINWTGQVMPVAEIAQEAKKRDILVMVDGAHSFAHLVFQIPDLQCDFFGTSLHKWMCAPFGTGMLYVKKDRISDLWPLFPNPEPKSDDIRKFEFLGTRNIPTELAIAQAVDFHLGIGAQRKFERLHFLKQYWVEKTKDIPGIIFWCPEQAEYSGAITTFGMKGKTGAEISSALQREYMLHTTSVVREGVDGCRITPNVYTSLSELDQLVDAIRAIAKK